MIATLIIANVTGSLLLLAAVVLRQRQASRSPFNRRAGDCFQ